MGTSSVMTRVVELLKATDASVMFPSGVNVISGVDAVLNSKPAGVLSTNVSPLPNAKSSLAPSAIVMAAKVVHAGEPPSAAVSAEICSPPAAPVTITLAIARFTPTDRTAVRPRLSALHRSFMSTILKVGFGLKVRLQFGPRGLDGERIR